jgi:hypothetical protein
VIWLHTVLVDDPEYPEAHVDRLVVVVEGERVEGIQPAVDTAAPLMCRSFSKHKVPF